MKQHISYSEFKDWCFCPQYRKLSWVDNLNPFNGNIYTAFGKAMHAMCELSLQGKLDSDEDKRKYFSEMFKKELENLNEEDRKDLIIDSIKDFNEQGKMMCPMILPALREKFGNYELVATEELLYEDVEGQSYKFKGLVDLVIKTEDGKYHILDYKTCGFGWLPRKKSDAMTTYQLTLYKHFFAQKHSVDPKEIETYFFLLKRIAKKDNVEIFRVTSGEKKTKNVMKKLNMAITNIVRGKHLKNRLKCNWCVFKDLNYCK